LKAVLLILSGFLVTSGAFAGGVVYAVSLLTVKTGPVTTLNMDWESAWTTEPVRIVAAETSAREEPEAPTSKGRIKVEARLLEAVDEQVALENLVTASFEDSAPSDAPAVLPVTQAHLDWCADRYRSYDVATDSYTSYSGKTRPCRSPYGTQNGTAPR
jgi:hypothetical protein